MVSDTGAEGTHHALKLRVAPHAPFAKIRKNYTYNSRVRPRLSLHPSGQVFSAVLSTMTQVEGPLLELLLLRALGTRVPHAQPPHLEWVLKVRRSPEGASGVLAEVE